MDLDWDTNIVDDKILVDEICCMVKIISSIAEFKEIHCPDPESDYGIDISSPLDVE